MTLFSFLPMRPSPYVGVGSGAAAAALTYQETVLLDSPSFVIPMQDTGSITDVTNLIGSNMLLPGGSNNPTINATGPGWAGASKAFSWPNADAEFIVEPTPADTAFDLNSGSFTLEAWIKPASGNNGAGDEKVIAYRRIPAGGREDFVLRLGNGAATNAHAYAAGTTIQIVAEVGSSAWTHVVMVRNGTDLRVYYNGVVQTPTANDSANSGGASGQFLIGTVPGAGTQRYKGLMCWVAGYKTALSAARVLAHYQAAV